MKDKKKNYHQKTSLVHSGRDRRFTQGASIFHLIEPLLYYLKHLRNITIGISSLKVFAMEDWVHQIV